MGLEEYRKKRSFSKTPEPRGGADTSEGNRFVIQEHHARNLHWDLRLERDGVLKSWAVPKGVPEQPGIKRLAIPTEDHPMEYAAFEGTIPEGEYGAGTVSIWDAGTYTQKRWTDREIEVDFHGKRITGPYAMIKTKMGWLVFKKASEP